MTDELGKKQEELKKIEQELKQAGLSRRSFLNRLSAVGVGFGAAATLGVKAADAANPADASVNVSSTNPTVDEILAESRANGEDPLQHMAQYGRWGYRRWYRRYYYRYRRYYYRRWYRRW